MEFTRESILDAIEKIDLPICSGLFYKENAAGNVIAVCPLSAVMLSNGLSLSHLRTADQYSDLLGLLGGEMRAFYSGFDDLRFLSLDKKELQLYSLGVEIRKELQCRGLYDTC